MTRVSNCSGLRTCKSSEVEGRHFSYFWYFSKKGCCFYQVEKCQVHPVFPKALVQSIAYLESQCSSGTTNYKASYKAIQSLKILIWHLCFEQSMEAIDLEKFKVFTNCIAATTAFSGILLILFG